jgi:ABC-2 type transport system ATP-binding protein
MRRADGSIATPNADSAGTESDLAMVTGTAADNGVVVRAVGLTKVFADFWLRQKAVAVDGVDLEIRRDEIFGLLGPNGSGKSTTIKMILGLLHRTKGVLSVFGKEPTDVSVKKRIGYLPEESYMYRFLTPVETLDFYGKLFGLPRAVRKRRTGELLEMVGMTHAANRPVGEFSKGMARRLGIAQSLINDPELLILDEPTSGLDPLGSRQVKDLILDLGRRGKTILLSSHQLDDVQDVCDRMVILYGGRIRSEGTVDQLLEDSGRSVITVPRLDRAAEERVRRVLHDEAHVDVERVAAPRQRLEDLFLEIVERARADKAATSGAGAGGPTASFLLGEDAAQGEGSGLIDRLAAASTVDAATPAPAPADAPADREIVDGLVGGAPSAPQAGPAAPAAAPQVPKGSPAQPDRSVIDDLLGGGGGRP